MSFPTQTTMSKTTDLKEQLVQVGLLALAECVEDFLARAAKGRLSPRQIIEEIVRLETTEGARRSLERRLVRSRIGRFKPITDFDWSWPKKIERDVVERALTLDFLEDGRNFVLLGANGLGKTMIAKNLAYQAAVAGYSVLFVTAAELLDDLRSEVAQSTFRRKLTKYASPRLLVIDEVGYLSYSNRHADMLFELVSRRYLHKSTVVTTNRRFADWGEVFPNAACVVSLVDRLMHRAEVVRIEGDSYRQKEAEERAVQRTAARTAAARTKAASARKPRG
jgi:DNA replication protein DnaC